LENLHAFEQLASTQLDESAEALYNAVENIRNIGLGLSRPDATEIQDKLTSIAAQLGHEGEIILNQKALSSGVRFFPRYLNDMMADYPEYVDTRDPGPVKSHGQ
jgi:hypothetical protein